MAKSDWKPRTGGLNSDAIFGPRSSKEARKQAAWQLFDPAGHYQAVDNGDYTYVKYWDGRAGAWRVAEYTRESYRRAQEAYSLSRDYVKQPAPRKKRRLGKRERAYVDEIDRELSLQLKRLFEGDD